jgi:hypothetical protein
MAACFCAHQAAHHGHADRIGQRLAGARAVPAPPGFDGGAAAVAPGASVDKLLIGVQRG